MRAECPGVADPVRALVALYFLRFGLATDTTPHNAETARRPILRFFRYLGIWSASIVIFNVLWLILICLVRFVLYDRVRPLPLGLPPDTPATRPESPSTDQGCQQ